MSYKFRKCDAVTITTTKAAVERLRRIFLGLMFEEERDARRLADALCAVVGHERMLDMDNDPAHAYCVVCGYVMPGGDEAMSDTERIDLDAIEKEARADLAGGRGEFSIIDPWQMLALVHAVRAAIRVAYAVDLMTPAGLRAESDLRAALHPFLDDAEPR